MEVRYLAAAGSEAGLGHFLEQRLQRLSEQRLVLLLRRPGFAFLASSSTPHVPMRDGAGVLVGRLFDRASGERVEDVAPDLEAQVRRTGGRSLIEGQWGGYALFVSDGAASHWVLRDPSGSIPVYFFEADGLHLYCPDARIAGAAGLGVRPDPDFARRWLLFPYLRAARTAFAGVSELLGGTRRLVDREETRIDLLWNPWRYTAKAKRLTDFDEAAALLRAEALRVIPAQVAGLRLLLQLSGGLDSSIVAAALAQAAIPFRAANYATLGVDGDERRHARTMAEAASIDLLEIVEQDRAPEFDAEGAPDFRPGRNPVLRSMQAGIESHALSIGAEAVVDGTGGDNLFCYLTTTAPILDAARERRWQRSLGAVRDVAELGDCTIWTALSIAACKAVRRRPCWRRDASFLGEPGLGLEPDPHPWLDFPPGTPIGKREHVEALVHIQHFLDRRGPKSPFVIHPLLAQPLMELCLRIPTWLWVNGGRDRAVARAAFDPLLPREILDRRVKGSLESLFVRAWMKSRGRLAELLLGGHLRELGIIDAAAVEHHLQQPGEPSGTAHVRLTEMAALELWLRSWRC